MYVTEYTHTFPETNAKVCKKSSEINPAFLFFFLVGNSFRSILTERVSLSFLEYCVFSGVTKPEWVCKHTLRALYHSSSSFIHWSRCDSVIRRGSQEVVAVVNGVIVSKPSNEDDEVDFLFWNKL